MAEIRNDELSPIKRALLELREMQARLDALQERQHEPVAIIGAGLRFPGGASDLESFWRLLHEGRDAITEVPPERWDIEAYYDPDPAQPGRMTTRFGGFLDGIDQFDAPFFGISPREAMSMDPQQRLLLEVTWEALENAGQPPDQLFGSQTGVFVGISNSDYMRLVLGDINQLDVYSTTGSAYSIAGGRLSYFMGLQGPNISIDTACSSSLVAVHLAVQSLRLRESHLALAGGVGLILTPEINVNFSKSQMMAADGRCKTFDAAADGYVRGEGCGMVVLKRLSDALADGDPVLAVIRGSAVNQDGRSGGLTAPNGPSQERVLAAALANARVRAEDVSYIEAHGTGTSLGDPIEVQALGAVFGPAHSAENPLLVGSVKTNIGHLEAAAGIAGLLKVVAALQKREIPAHLHLTQPNPYIPWAELPIVIPTRHTAWAAPEGKRTAGVSSFGFSGTNAHVIVQEAPVVAAALPAERPLHLLTLSAQNPKALAALAERYRDYLAANRDVSLADVCYAAARRAHLNYRLAAVTSSLGEAYTQLASYTTGEMPAGVFAGQGAGQPEIAFLFTGHGSHYAQMGRQLYETQPVFRAVVDRCDELLRPYLEQPLLAALFPQEGQPSLLKGMAYTQPALFSIQVALAELWRSWGVEPAFVMGHSVGEYAAACVAGVFSLEDGLKLVAARGRLMEGLPENGQMVVVFADEDVVAEIIAPFSEQISIAVINGPQNTVISGKSETVETVVEILKEHRIKARRLAVAQASHSPLIEPLLDEFERVLESVSFSEPSVALISCTTGAVVGPAEVTQAAYWRRHIRQPVRFATAVETLYGQGLRIFVEIGPNPTLLALGKRCVPDNAGVWLPSLREGISDWLQLLESVGQLYVQGAALNWDSFYRGAAQHRLALPTYPFQRASYWTDAARTAASPKSDVWNAMRTAVQHQADYGPLDLILDSYPQRWDCLDRLTSAHIIHTLAELGVFTQADERHTIEDLLAHFGVQPVYANLMRRWLHKLAALGWLTERDGVFARPQPLPPADLDAIWDETRSAMADLPFVLDYFERCGAKLTSVLTGADSALDTLFPGGSFGQAENLYQRWPLSRYFAGMVRAALEAVVNALPPGKPLRVLEIGGGTGATTASLLPVLPPDRTVYTFTDVSDMFLAHAARKFAAYPFVRYGLLNIEQAPQEQGYGRHSYDVIVAVNVLHATRDVNQTVQHVQSLLAAGGMLLLNETTEHLPWYDMTTGLIGGWQRFEDNLRTDNPLLKPEQWAEVLQANGFGAAQAWPDAGSAAEILGQHVIVAQVSQAGVSQQSDTDGGGQAAEAYAAPQETAAEHSRTERMLQLQAALPDERHDLLVDYVRQGVIRVLRLDAGQALDRHSPLLDMGLDSLMALELRGFLDSGLALPESLPATLVFDYPTISAVASYLESMLGLAGTVDDVASEAAPARASQQARAAEIENLSDDDVAALLLKKFRR